jgi:hypothetical protein
VAEVITDSSGQFSFESLPFGAYAVVYEFKSGVVVEAATPIILTAKAPSFVQPPVPALALNYQDDYGPLSFTPLAGSPGRPNLQLLNLRNPANVTGEEVSRFIP